ncbi:FAD/NAD(P)-binding domain-containing protein [Annulohypoxylon truncatum]|uniref:FAD/NAD(P)-binding domain-containing protein n=1 Tax=Annulohypoxylon truncatum TaxID=327061 RepID=UPI0020087AEB|nr:FAD/NAD(P)-binding domain-containing protein [Annulohypoxylon truncatum]KAI1213541.1 FAD/NAD(P)-binding domain-containing protein [Annulohypoxylon truncatum]
MERIVRSPFSLLTSTRRTRYTFLLNPSSAKNILLHQRNQFYTTNIRINNIRQINYKSLQSSVGMPLNVLIVGAGVAGPALAILLQKSDPNNKITVVERSPSLRVAGQQIDLKAQGVEILRKMGLLDTMKSHCVNETGVEILDSNGKQQAFFGINPSGQRRLTLTAEYEIMRGDAVKVLYEASLKQNAGLKEERGKEGELTYEFDKTITDLTQHGDGVDVTFSDGQKKRFDLVVAADGQGSRTRRLAFGQEVSDAAFKPLGVHAAYYSIPRSEGEGELARAYSAPGRRLVVTRTSGRPMTQVLLFTMGDGEKLRKSYKESVEKQKEAFAETYRGAGWEVDRLLSGMATCTDFYAHEVGQVRMDRWYKGRVALLGDAGYCPSPFTGMGTTGCLIGAYVLAGELARRNNDVPQALKAYEEIARPPINECQALPTESLGTFFPSSRLGIWVLRKFLWVVSKVEPITYKPQTEENQGWKVPEYPELNLKS